MDLRRLTVATVLVGTLGCATSMDRLVPAAEANKLEDMPNSAGVAAEGVTIAATVNVWPGMEEVKSKVTPVHVSIQNRSQRPLRIQYKTMVLIGDTGEQFAALPPFKVKGQVTRPVAVLPGDPVSPTWTQYGFTVAPYYASIYPDISVTSDPFLYEPSYYDRYYTAWQTVDLPTPNMLRYALPEGVVADGGRIDGFVYFQRIGGLAKRVLLQATLVDASTGETFGTAGIPFTVSSD